MTNLDICPPNNFLIQECSWDCAKKHAQIDEGKEDAGGARMTVDQYVYACQLSVAQLWFMLQYL